MINTFKAIWPQACWRVNILNNAHWWGRQIAMIITYDDARNGIQNRANLKTLENIFLATWKWVSGIGNCFLQYSISKGGVGKEEEAGATTADVVNESTGEGIFSEVTKRIPYFFLFSFAILMIKFSDWNNFFSPDSKAISTSSPVIIFFKGRPR